MKEKIIPFIKKYPMSILLAIIALNLSNINLSLQDSAEIDRQKLLCARMSAYYGKGEPAGVFAEELQNKFDLKNFESLIDYCKSLNGRF
tara:strand:+ start:228 stop:494 length:267 start_codon:yes stop_codon:yes gene_type:complete